MGQLRFTCFGAFEITLNDTRLTTFPTEKVRALLVYLAVERQGHQRSALAQLLWPGYTAESANTSLRQTLRRLRQLLGDDEEAPGDTPWLLVTRQTVQFNPAAALSADVITFTELFAACAAHTHSHITTSPVKPAWRACVRRLISTKATFSAALPSPTATRLKSGDALAKSNFISKPSTPSPISPPPPKMPAMMKPRSRRPSAS